MKNNIAIVGASGLVGSKFLEILEQRPYIKINKLYLYASERSAGKIIRFRNKNYKIIPLCENNIRKKKIDYAFFSAGGDISKKYAKFFTEIGATVIDNSSTFRMDENVPLVVPEVNFSAITKSTKLIANPNCSTIQCMLPLKCLDDLYQLNKIQYVTFQAVSGSGMKGIADLEKTKKGEKNEFYPHPIFNNCLPHIDSFLDNGYTKEEMKMINETNKILNLQNVPISATCVRVPIENSHSVEIYAEFKKPFKIDDIKTALSNFDNIIVLDDPNKNMYPLATLATGTDKVFVGRIRRSLYNSKGVHIFCVADNIRKGAALNGVQILERLLTHKLKKNK